MSSKLSDAEVRAELARLRKENSLLEENASLHKRLQSHTAAKGRGRGGGGKGGRGGDSGGAPGRGGASSKGGRHSKPESIELSELSELSTDDAVIAIVRKYEGKCLLSILGIEMGKKSIGYGDHQGLKSLVKSIAQLKVEGSGGGTTAIIRKDDRDVSDDS